MVRMMVLLSQSRRQVDCRGDSHETRCWLKAPAAGHKAAWYELHGWFIYRLRDPALATDALQDPVSQRPWARAAVSVP